MRRSQREIYLGSNRFSESVLMRTAVSAPPALNTQCWTCKKPKEPSYKWSCAWCIEKQRIAREAKAKLERCFKIPRPAPRRIPETPPGDLT